MPTLSLSCGQLKKILHFITPHQSREFSSLKLFPYLRGGKCGLGTLKCHCFLNIYLPCQTSFCPLIAFGVEFGVPTPWEVTFHGTCEHHPLDTDVTQCLWACIFIIMPNNGFFPVTFCNVVSHTSLHRLARPGIRAQSVARDPGGSPTQNDKWASLSHWAHGVMGQGRGTECHGYPLATWHSFTPHTSGIPNLLARNPFDRQVKSTDPPLQRMPSTA